MVTHLIVLVLLGLLIFHLLPLFLLQQVLIKHPIVLVHTVLQASASHLVSAIL